MFAKFYHSATGRRSQIANGAEHAVSAGVGLRKRGEYCYIIWLGLE